MTQRITPRYMHITAAAVIGLAQGTTDSPQNVESVDNKLTVANYVWSSSALAWVVSPLSSTGGGGAGSTVSDVNLTSAGSTKLVGQVTVANPTTSVSLSSQATVTLGNPTTAVDANLTSVGSTKLIGLVAFSSQPTITASGTTAVDATLTSAGSTRVVGSMTLTSAPSTNPVAAFTLANPTTSVTLAAGSSATLVGSVIIGTGGSTANPVGSVALLAGSSANILGSVVLNSGTTDVTIGGVVIEPGSSANMVGNVAQGVGSSNNFWTFDGFAFTSGLTSRTSVSSTVDTQLVAANANRKAMVIANLSTSQTVGIGLTTNAVTTGLANVSVYLPPATQISFGGYGGNFPGYTGPVRGINLTSTTVGGGVAVTQFLNT